jgi:D-aminopeptidase
VAFADGTPAAYGFGLGRQTEHARHLTGHGGALRGWRSHRMHVAADRVSVVVLFNHMADARTAAMDLLAAVLGEPAAPEGEVPPMPDWTGAYVEPETGLAVRIDPHAPGRVRLRFGHTPEVLTLRPDGSASSDGVTLRPEPAGLVPAGLVMERADERLSSLLQPRAGGASSDIAGRYRNAELDAELRIEDAGGVLYGAFAGFLGAGRMEMLDAIGPDLWALPCPRALDHTPPGDWTLAIRRDGSDRPSAVEVGCWLARGLVYERCTSG